MIILDTNVVSEPLRPHPDTAVIDWLDAQSVETLYLTTLTVAEVRYGIAALPRGRRASALRERFDCEVLPLFDKRILDFTLDAASSYGQLRAAARAAGVGLGEFDALIAAIAVSTGFAVATRDVSPFVSVGVEVINPFS